MLIVCVLISAVSLVTAYEILSNTEIHHKLIEKGLFGKDMHRKGRPIIPEAMGVLAGMNYIVSAILLIPFIDVSFILKYLTALLSLTCMLFLGFCDDLFDLRWRYKLLLPMLASIPLVVVYTINDGVTWVVLPKLIFNRAVIDIGYLYYVFMTLLSVFCTNAINIYAGINGVEVGQSLVIAISLLLNDCLYVFHGYWWSDFIVDSNSNSANAEKLHLFSMYLLIPFVFISLALFSKNRYPASIFVGDSFCYFAGMTFSCVGILGKYSKTLLLFFIPQIFNFIYSVPQLFKIIPCPRHRMPDYDAENDILRPSYVLLEDGKIKRLGNLIVYSLKTVGLLHEKEVIVNNASETTARETSPVRNRRMKQAIGETKIERKRYINNMTLLNFLLIKFGPMPEWKLCWLSLTVQVLLGSVPAFLIRYGIVYVLY